MSDDPYKCILVGDSGVGKTNILTQYVSHEFSEDTQATIGVEFQTKAVKIDGRDIKLQIWDTAGQERFRAISRSIYHGAKGVIVAYDITNQSSFDNLNTWLQEVRSLIPPQAPIMICGNKCDLDHARVVKKDVADAFARSQNLVLFETSAKDRTNVDRAFDHLVKLMHEAVMQAQANGLTIGRPTPNRAVPGRPAPPGASVDLTRPENKNGNNNSNNNNGGGGAGAGGNTNNGDDKSGGDGSKCPC
jgi:small GTP-binding protein